MKNTNKILSILLAIVLILSSFPVLIANAADETITFSAQAEFTKVDGVDVVNVNINMSENSSLAALMLFVNYDNTALKILDVESKKVFGYEEFNSVYANNQLAYLTASANAQSVGGTLFTIKFKVLKDVCTEISLSVNELTNIDLKPIPSETQSVITHKYNSVVKAPTCTTDGYTTYTCSVCEDTYTETVAALGHNYNSVVTEPTCTTDGYTTHTCSVCDDTYKDGVITAPGHSYDSVVTEPTCTTDGYTTHTCSVCDDTYKDGVITAPGHKYDSVVTEPTCTTDGYTTHTCSVCDDTYTDNEISAPGHKYDSVVTEPTCTTDGYTTHTCSVCDDTYVDSETKATGHSYIQEVTKIPTHTENGEITYTCNVCDDSYSVIIEADGDHKHIARVTKAPTCTETGVMTYTCACTDEYSEDIPALGHKYESVVTAPKCTVDGYTTYTCSVCSDTYVDDETSALGHNYSSTVTTPTCTETGYTTYVCSVCDDSYVDDKTEATGHSFSKGNCTVCGDEDPDYYVFSVVEPSQTKIRNRDGIILHSEIEGRQPNGSYVVWTSDNDNFDKIDLNDGMSLKVIARNKGNTVFTATLYDADNNKLASESVTIYSNSGFFQKIGGFFRSLFGATTIYDK